MFASFEYQLSNEEYAKALRVTAVALRAQDRRGIWWCFAYLALLISAIAIASTLNPGTLDGIIAAIAILFLGFVFIQAQQVRTWRRLSFDPGNADLKLTFDDRAIVERSQLSESRWEWDAVRLVCDLPEAIVLVMGGWHVIALPSRLWPEASGRSEFISRVRNNAPNLLPDLSPYNSRLASPNRLTIGAVAAAFVAFALVSMFEGRLLCGCAMRSVYGYGRAGYLLFAALWLAAPFVAGAVMWALAHVGLKWLNKRSQKAASVLANLFILGFVVLLFIGMIGKSHATQ